jgi:hypothetical protein
LAEPYETEVHGALRYVILTDGTSFIENVQTGKCREVLIVREPKVFHRKLRHPPRDV